MEYEFWEHAPTGEIYAVQLLHGRIQGICGPCLDYELEMSPRYFKYDLDKAAVADDHRAEFRPLAGCEPYGARRRA